MSKLREAAERYIQLRRQLGYKLHRVSYLLRNFVAFAEREDAAHVTTDLALRWARQPLGAQPAIWASRLGVVRRFAAWLSASDRGTEVPPSGLLPCRYRRRRPYIYSDAEVESIVRVANRLSSPAGLRGRTFSTLFGLLAVTGLRVSEALALDRKDVDLGEGLLQIRGTKFGKSRLVAVHASTREALAGYAGERDRLVRRPATEAFFLSEKGSRMTGCSADDNFAKVSREVGLRAPTPGRRRGRGPRLHDLRHRFAVCILLKWYRAGVDVGREIPKLAAYLGHAHVNELYWYIEAVPELLKLAADRLEGIKEAKP
ncbi:MAG TPA: tyrosine-type recombinase/integrase [Acidimicrobiales bacterium]|nr:tyrosine-type recombinase/integrase [Acidimicrobiales bacterium]